MRLLFMLGVISVVLIASCSESASPEATETPTTSSSGELVEAIQSVLEGSVVEPYFRVEDLSGVDSDVLEAVLAAAPSIPNAEQDPVRTLETIAEAAVGAGYELQSGDFGLSELRDHQQEVRESTAAIRDAVRGTQLDSNLSRELLLQLDPPILSAIQSSLSGVSDVGEDPVSSLDTVLNAATNHGYDVDVHGDLGLEEAENQQAAILARLRDEIVARADGTDADAVVTRARLANLSPDVLEAIGDALGDMDLNQDPLVTLEQVAVAAEGAGLDLANNDLGLAEAREERAREEELASRPRIEVVEVDITRDFIGTPVVNITLRNNHTARVDAVDLRAWAYNRFGEGLGGQCGRFPTYYSTSTEYRAIEGETFKIRGNTLCVDSATRFDVVVDRVHFTDGSVWSP